MFYSAFKNFGPVPKFGHFEVFGVKFSGKKSIFNYCLFGSFYGAILNVLYKKCTCTHQKVMYTDVIEYNKNHNKNKY